MADARKRIVRTELAIERTEEMVAENIALARRMRTAVEVVGPLVKVDPTRTN